MTILPSSSIKISPSITSMRQNDKGGGRNQRKNRGVGVRILNLAPNLLPALGVTLSKSLDFKADSPSETPEQ